MMTTSRTDLAMKIVDQKLILLVEALWNSFFSLHCRRDFMFDRSEFAPGCA